MSENSHLSLFVQRETCSIFKNYICFTFREVLFILSVSVNLFAP